MMASGLFLNGRCILFPAPSRAADRIVPDGVVAVTHRCAVRSNGELYLTAHVVSDAAGSLCSPAALLWCAAGKLQSR